MEGERLAGPVLVPTPRGDLVAEAHGPLDGPGVLLVAGGGGDRRSWRRLLPELCTDDADRDLWKPVRPSLADRFRVAVFDQAGVGDSVHVNPCHTSHDYAEDALAVGRALLGERFIVLGESLGGLAAQVMALDAPDNVIGVVLACTMAGATHFVPAPPRELSGLPPAPDSALADAGSQIAGSFSSGWPLREPELFWAVAAQVVRLHPDAASAMIELMVQHELSDRLGALAQPTVVVSGDDDQTISLPNSRHLAQLIPGARLVVHGAGHNLHVEAPAALIDAVAAVALLV